MVQQMPLLWPTFQGHTSQNGLIKFWDKQGGTNRNRCIHRDLFIVGSVRLCVCLSVHAKTEELLMRNWWNLVGIYVMYSLQDYKCDYISVDNLDLNLDRDFQSYFRTFALWCHERPRTFLCFLRTHSFNTIITTGEQQLCWKGCRLSTTASTKFVETDNKPEQM